jgi:hypothetical protein
VAVVTLRVAGLNALLNGAGGRGALLLLPRPVGAIVTAVGIVVYAPL